jgi:hypothetical protein
MKPVLAVASLIFVLLGLYAGTRPLFHLLLPMPLSTAASIAAK